MSSFIDTNVVVRYVTGEPAHLAALAAEILEGEGDLYLTEGILAEITYVLRKNYEVPRELAIETLIDFIRRKNVQIYGLDKDLVIEALMLCQPSGRVSVSDAMLWAIARSTGENSRVYSFDRRFPGEEIEVRYTP